MRSEENRPRLLPSMRLPTLGGLFLLIFLGAGSSSQAQGTQDAAVECFFNVVYVSFVDSGGMREAEPLNLKFFANQEPVHLSTRSGDTSEFFSHRGAPDLYFYHENGTDEEGNVIYQPVLSVSLGTSGQKLILVIQKPDGSLGARVFDMSEEVFPLNHAQLLNFSKQPMMVRLGEEVGAVAPLTSKNFPVEIEQRRSAINFALATRAEGQPEIIEMKRIAFTKNRRCFILVYNDPSEPAKIRHRIFPMALPTIVENRSSEELEAEDYEKYLRDYRSGEE